MNEHNPLRRAFWLGSFDPRPLALFRICFGLAVLQDLADMTRDFRVFFTDGGMLPRYLPRDWFAWSLFDLVGTPVAVGALYAVGVLSMVAFTVGYRTRVATVVSWVWLLSLHNRNYFVTDGGDNLASILLFWSIFADLGGCWSVDAARSGVPYRAVPAFGLRLLQGHIAGLYFVAARLKVLRGWLHGTAIFETLQLTGFVRPLGAWLDGHSSLCSVATYAILFMEGGFAFVAFSPFWIRPCRAIALAFGLAIQLGIAMCMRVGIFQQAMLATCALFVLPEWLDSSRALTKRRRAVAPDTSPTPMSWKPPLVLYAVVSLQFIVTFWDFFVGRRFPLPTLVKEERSLLGLEQPADLFGTIWEIHHWRAPGVLADGTQIDVLSVVAPGASPQGPAWKFSRWNKFTFKEHEHPLPWPTLGPYLCRAFNEAVVGPRLQSFTAIDDLSFPHRPYQPPVLSPPRVLWQQSCDIP